jgi:hypothetical protein
MSRWTWLGGRLLPRASALAGDGCMFDWLLFVPTGTTSLADRFDSGCVPTWATFFCRVHFTGTRALIIIGIYSVSTVAARDVPVIPSDRHG